MIAQDDSLRQFLTTSRDKIRKKKLGNPNLGQMSQNWVQNQVFCHFFKFDSLVFLKIAQDDSLEHYLITSRSKTHGKNFGAPKLGPNLGFFAIFSRLHIQFSLILHKIAARDNVYYLLELKPHKKKKKKQRNNYRPDWGLTDLFYSNVVERPLKLACSNLLSN